MDKYTYSIKAEKIQKLVKKGEYEAAVKIADTVDWEEVHSVRLLTITASAYENLKDYKSAIELLQMAYEESAVGKRILYKLTGLAIADGDLNLAQHYYEMYLQEASDDNGRYLLRYLLAELKQEPLDKRIAILETYRKYEFEEEWALRLAQMYDEAGMSEECVKLCDEIILWFGVGEYVDEAMTLKEKYAPLSEEQREHRENKEFYEQRYQEIVDEYKEREEVFLNEDEEETPPVADEAWTRQIMLLEAESLEEAVPRTLEKLAQYYRAKGENIGKLTKISAERFNQVGFEAAREHTKGKDLLIDEAGALSEELLSDIVHSVKYEANPQVYILADKPEQLAYLDARLGEYKRQESTIPQIAVSELRSEEVLSNVSAVMDEELKDSQEAAETPDAQTVPAAGEAVSDAAVSEKKAETAAAAAPLTAQELAEQEAEQISFRFDDVPEEEAPEKETAEEKAPEEMPAVTEHPAPAPEETAKEPVLPELKALDLELGQMNGDLLDFSAVSWIEEEKEKEENALPEVTDVTEEAETQEAEETITEENPRETEEFITEESPQEAEEVKTEERPQAAAEIQEVESQEVIEKKDEAASPEIAEETEEALPQEGIAEEKQPEILAEAHEEESSWDFGSFFEEQPLEEKQIQTAAPVMAGEAVKETKEIPIEKIRQALREQETAAPDKTEAAAVPEGATQVMSGIRKKIEEAEKESKPLEGETKVLPKVSMATGKIGAIGMSEEAFVAYAKNYINSIDCVLDEAGELALQNAAEARREKGMLLTKEVAENMIEDAADRAERKGGLFAKRYNKEGCLILRSKYIE